MRPGVAAAREDLCDPAYQDCRSPLWTLIKNETTEIDVGLWYMTDPSISNLIVQRFQAGVRVRILMDPREFGNPDGSQSTADKQVIDQLSAAGIPLRKRVASGIEHWKVMVFAGQNTVYFGSSNFSGYELAPIRPWVNYSDDIAYFTDDMTIVQSFMTEFDKACVDTTGYATYANPPTSLVRSYPVYAIDPSLDFVPDQDYATRAVHQYDAETQRIDFDMFRITDLRHTNAITAAAARAVGVRLIWHSHSGHRPSGAEPRQAGPALRAGRSDLRILELELAVRRHPARGELTHYVSIAVVTSHNDAAAATATVDQVSQ